MKAKCGNLQKCVLNKSPTMREQSEILAVRKLLNSKIITVYHGTKNDALKPLYGRGKLDCDYGQGFYTTPELKLAKEWAWSSYTAGDKGYVYTYQLDTTGLERI